MNPRNTVRLLQNPPSLAGWEQLGLYRNEALFFDHGDRLILMVGRDAYEISLDAAQQWAANRDLHDIRFPIGDDLPEDVRSAYDPDAN